MTRTEERLADALGAAARSVRADTLSPLVVPGRQRGTRHAWVAPVAAAVALLLTVGLGAAISGHFPGAGHAVSASAPAGPPPRYYVSTNVFGKTAVHATATGAVTATVPLPAAAARGGAVAAAADGEFFVVGPLVGVPTGSDWVYRFRLTGTGQPTGLSAVPGVSFSGVVEAVAASPDGSQLAIALHMGQSAEIVILNTATGTHSVWRGGMDRPGDRFGIASLSWTGNGGELVFLGQWCANKHVGPSRDEFSQCATIPTGNLNLVNGVDVGPPEPGVMPADAQVRALDPKAAGGTLDSGPVLLGQSAQYPHIMQAVISPDGSTVTALVVSQGRYDKSKPAGGPLVGIVPGQRSSRVTTLLLVDQIQVGTGAQLRVLYQTGGLTYDVSWLLIPDSAGDHWLVNDAEGDVMFLNNWPNGDNWLGSGRLTSLRDQAEIVVSEAWSAPPPRPAPVASHAAARVTPQAFPPGTMPRYVVETGSDGWVVVHSTATGLATAGPGIPRSPGALVTAAANGTFFVAARAAGSAGLALYEFRLTRTGEVTGLSKLPGGAIGTGNDQADAIAAAPDGSQVAVAIGPEGPFCSGVPCQSAEEGKGADYIAVVNVATGARSLWRGGMPSSLYIPSLSWTANGRELVFLAQTCQAGPARSQILTGCMPSLTGQPSLTRQSSEVWALDPVPGGGRLGSAHLLLSQSAGNQDIAQAVINSDGSTITAVLVTGPTSESPPADGQAVVSVAQISVTTGRQVAVLYREVVGRAPGTDQTVAPFVSPSPAPLLTSDGTGRYWLLVVPYPEVNGTARNGWIRAGQLVELPSGGPSVASEAW